MSEVTPFNRIPGSPVDMEEQIIITLTLGTHKAPRTSEVCKLPIIFIGNS